MRNLWIASAMLVALILFGHQGRAREPQTQAEQSGVAEAQSKIGEISGQVTFVYYNELDKADAFYSKILGVQPSLSLDWVKIYRLSSTSSIGLVNGTRGSHRPSPTKPVTISLIVNSPDQVDQWFSKLKALGVKIGKEPRTGNLSADISIRSFMFEDPEGYTLEVFAWIK